MELGGWGDCGGGVILFKRVPQGPQIYSNPTWDSGPKVDRSLCEDLQFSSFNISFYSNSG